MFIFLMLFFPNTKYKRIRYVYLLFVYVLLQLTDGIGNKEWLWNALTQMKVCGFFLFFRVFISKRIGIKNHWEMGFVWEEM